MRKYCDDGSEDTDFRGISRSNDTHASKTDTDARQYRKGKTASKLRYCVIRSDNRDGLTANARVTLADSCAGRRSGQSHDQRCASRHPENALTFDDAAGFIEALQEMQV